MQTVSDGFTINYSDDDGIRFLNDIFKNGEYDSVLESQNNTILDIGAHIGLFSMRAYPFAKQIYAIEPDPTNFALLKQNIDANNLENVIPYNCALSNTEGKFTLRTPSSSGGWELHRDEGPVQTHTLSVFVTKFVAPDTIDIIKCDTEGSEGNIFGGPGASEILKTVKAVIMEHGQGLGRMFMDLGFKVENKDRITICKR
jgi:FkbM family methyltransferase